MSEMTNPRTLEAMRTQGARWKRCVPRAHAGSDAYPGLFPPQKLDVRPLLPASLRPRSLFGHLRKFLPPVFLNPLRELILAAGQMIKLSLQFQVVFEARGVERARLQSFAHGATRLGLVLAVAEVTLSGQFLDIFKSGFNALFDVPQLQFAHARGVQDQRSVGNRDQFAVARRVPASVVLFPDFLDPLPVETQQSVDQC